MEGGFDMMEMRNEADLESQHKYVVIKISDLYNYLSINERSDFWKSFWTIEDNKEK